MRNSAKAFERLGEVKMDCCGHGPVATRRRWMRNLGLTSVGATLGGGFEPRGSTAAAQVADTTDSALDVLRKSK